MACPGTGMVAAFLVNGRSTPAPRSHPLLQSVHGGAEVSVLSQLGSAAAVPGALPLHPATGGAAEDGKFAVGDLTRTLWHLRHSSLPGTG